jgi:hypothetical protein
VILSRSKKKNHPKIKKLEQLTKGIRDRFYSTHLKASQWLDDKGLDLQNLKMASKAAITATSLAGAVITSKPVDALVNEQIAAIKENKKDDLIAEVTQSEFETVMNKLKQMVLRPPGHLEQEDELYLEQQLSDMLGFEVTAELDGHRLNHSIGIMGGEQHLRRFPSDTLDQHDAYQQAGIAPARGAFGWFTENGELTEDAIMREKYYFAVQTLYLPDWNSNYQELKPWYKFRKMVVVNPADEVAVVGVVGDAGPALWVNKQFGGSPEIIREGKIWSPEAKGRIMLLFVDDPEDKIPLGPINLNQIKDTLAEADVEVSEPVAAPLGT